jgi:diguanylate cyclase (GGDEF)-like protein
MVDACPVAMMTTTEEGQIIEANPAAHKLFHRGPQDLHGTPVFPYLVDEHDAPLQSVIGPIIKGFGAVNDRHVYVKWGSGSEDRTSCRMTVYPLFEEDKESGERVIYRVVGIFRDQTEVETLATTDELTGLLNKRGFMDRLAEYVRLSRRKNWPLAIAYLDVSKFKPINDTYGHDEGDRVLMKLGARLKQSTFDTDIPGRLHGDEFVVLLVRPNRDSLKKIAAKLVDATRFRIDLRFKERLHSVGTISSIGICWREGGRIPEDPKLFLHLADQAMFRCKHAPEPAEPVIDDNGQHEP